MELVETVLALEEKVKRLESQVKALQTPKPAVTNKPLPTTPTLDVSAVKQQLRSEFVSQLNQLQAELAEVKTRQTQYQPATSTQEPFKLSLSKPFIALGMVVSGLGLWLVLWLSKPTAIATQVSPAISSPIVSLKAKPTSSAPLKKSKRQTAKTKPLQQPKLLDQAEVDQTTAELEAEGYHSSTNQPH